MASLLKEADRLWLKSEYQQVLEVADRIIKKSPNNSEGFRFRAGARRNLKDAKGAREDFDRALEIDPKNLRAWHGRGILRRQQNDLPGALADVSRALELGPNYTNGLDTRAQIYFELKEYKKSIADSSKALELAPGYPLYLVKRGLALEATGDLNGALKDFEAVLSKSANDGSALEGRGNVLSKLKRFEEAIPEYTKALKAGRSPGYVLLQRGKAYQARGMKADAEKDLVQALQKNPESRETRELLAKLRQEPGQEAARSQPGRNEAPAQAGTSSPKKGGSASPAPGVAAAPTPAITPSPKKVILPPFAGFQTEDLAEQAKLKDPRFPWADKVVPSTPLPPASLAAHHGAVRHAKTRLLSTYGNLTPQQVKDFDRIWAAFSDFPTAESLAYMKQVNPTLDEYVEVATEEEAIASAYRDSLVQIAVAAGPGDGPGTQSAIDLAVTHAEALKESQQRMEKLAANLKRLGNPPNPIAAKAAAQNRHQTIVLGAGASGKDPAGVKRSGLIRIEIDQDGPILTKTPIKFRAVVPPNLTAKAKSYYWTGFGSQGRTNTPEVFGAFKAHPNWGFAYVNVSARNENDKEIAVGEITYIPLINQIVSFPQSAGSSADTGWLELEGGEKIGESATFSFKVKISIGVEYPNIGGDSKEWEKYFSSNITTIKGMLRGPYDNSTEQSISRGSSRLLPALSIGAFSTRPGEEIVERESYGQSDYGGQIGDDGFESASIEGVGFLRMNGESFTAGALAVKYSAQAVLRGCHGKCKGPAKAKFEELKRMIYAALAGAKIKPKEAPAPARQSEQIAKMDPATRAEAITHHEALVQHYDESARQWTDEANRTKDPIRRQELLASAGFDRDMAQSERDLVESLKTGTIVHTRTAWEDQQQQKLVENIKLELAEFEKDKQRLTLLPKFGALVQGEEGYKVRKALQEQIQKAIKAKDRGAQLDKLLGNMRRIVTTQREATAAIAEAEVAQAQYHLSTAEGIKEGADAALWAASFLVPGSGAISMAYGIGTGYVEGGVMQGLENSARAYSNYIDVAAAAVRGGLAVNPDTGQYGGVSGMVWEGSKTAVINHLMGWATKNSTNFIQGSINKARLPARPEAFKDNHERYREAVAQAKTPEQRQAIDQKYRVIVDRETLKRELKQTTDRHEAEARKVAGRPDGTIDTQHPQYKEIQKQWLADMAEVRTKHAPKETRMSEHDKTLAAANLRPDDMPLSGGEPKSVMSDLDLSPRSLAAGEAYVGSLKKGGREVLDFPDRWIVPDSDMTIWKPGNHADKPGSRSFEERVIIDALPGSDKFPTTGGVEFTTQGGVTYDPKGAVISNAKKAVEAGIGGVNSDLHVIAKSVDKAMEIAGTNADAALVGKLKAARTHATNEESGITTFGASTQVKARETSKFLKQSSATLETAYQAASATSNKITVVLNKQLVEAQKRGDKATVKEIQESIKGHAISNELTLNTMAVRDRATVAQLVGGEQPPGPPSLQGFSRMTEALTREREADENPKAPRAPLPALADLGERSKRAAVVVSERLKGVPAATPEGVYLKSLQKALEDGATNPARAVTEVRLISGFEIALVLKQLGVESKRP